MTPKGAWRRLLDYFGNPDPRVALANTVALIVVGNQPFYPFYVWYAADAAVPAAFLTWMSFPFFAAIPGVARRTANGGRALLIAAAIGNTTLSALALGSATRVELFYIPSLLVAGTTFRPRDRGVPLVAATVATLAGLTIVRLVGASLATLAPEQAQALSTMHAISVACLVAIILYRAWRMKTD